MNKTMKRFAVGILLLSLLVPLVACTASNGQNPIDFNKKYILSENDYLVFHSDGTGYREYKNVYENSSNPEYNYTQSGRISFAWRESSNGAVYLFRLSEEYYADHTEGKSLPMISGPIHFSDEFCTYTYYTQYGDNTRQYVKEGSNLEKLLKEAKEQKTA